MRLGDLCLLRPGIRQVQIVEGGRELGRRRQQLIAAKEGIGDAQQFRHVVLEVDRLQQAHHPIFARHGLHNGERTIVGRTQHDQSAASREFGAAHFIPQRRMPPDHVARYQSAHGVRDQMHRLTGKFRTDQIRERVG
ncbi:hypothetical protein D3C87_1717600 [compost metagenome]